MDGRKEVRSDISCRGSGSSGLPERLGAFDALLRPAEADVGQLAIVQGAEVPARAPAGAPKGPGGDEDGPETTLPRRRREVAKDARVGLKKHLFFLVIHLFQGQHRLV